MDWATMLLLCDNTGTDRERNDVIIRACEGDEVAGEAWRDVILERGIEPMQSLKIGDAVFIQTVTYFYLGKVASVAFDEIVLDNATCVYDTGRLSEYLQTGRISASEPFLDPVSISRAAVVAVTKWRHPLPDKPIGG
jgi:hypothetical protein